MFSGNPIYSIPHEGLFPHDHNYVSRYKAFFFKLNGLNRRDKISSGTMPGPNIPSLTILLEQLVSEKLG